MNEKETQSGPSKEQLSPPPLPEIPPKGSEKIKVNYVSVELNNGQKWKPDGVSAYNIFKLDSVIQEVDPFATDEVYERMMSACSDALDNAYYSNKYEGEAKTQYTKFLRTVVSASKYIISTDIAERKEAILVIRSHLATYSDYFE